MEKERLAEYLEQYHMGALNAATSRELELTFGIKGIQVRHMVNALRRDGVPIASNGSRILLCRHGPGGAGHHRPSDQADQRNRGRHPGTGSDSGARGYRTDPPAAGWG